MSAAAAAVRRPLLLFASGIARRSISATADGERSSACLYAVLGVGADASHCEIRQAFLSKAKALHPDVVHQQPDGATAPGSQAREGKADASLFLELMSAYEVLRSPSRRHRYDQLRHQRRPGQPTASGNGGFAASAGGSGQPGSGERQGTMDAAEAEADRWLLWLYHVVGGSRSPQGALVKQNSAPLRSALLEAYLGPWVDTSQGFPSCFEAEERNAGLTGVNDILHVVSGRQLLGTIRIPASPALEARAGSELLQLADSAEGMPLFAPRRASELGAAAAAEEEEKEDGHVHMPASALAAAADKCSSPQPPSSRQYHRVPQDRGRGSLGPELQSKPGMGSKARQVQRHPADTPLELTFAGGAVVARAVRSPAGTEPRIAAARHCGPAAGLRPLPPVALTDDGLLERDLISVWMKPEHSADGKEDVAMELVAHVEGLRGLGALGRRFRSAKVFNPEGQQTHTVVAHQTVGVRSLTWTQAKPGWVECRCQRAWLPPSEYWMFQPRVDTHSTGGWYFERYTSECRYTTSRQRRSMSPVLPAPCHLLVAAYESLDEEQHQHISRERDKERGKGRSMPSNKDGDEQAATKSRTTGWSSLLDSLLIK